MSFYKTFGLALVAAIAIVYGLVTAFGSREVTADHYSAVQKYVREGDLAPTAVAEAMEDGEDEPVIDAIHHRKLVHWACWRALNKRDSEQRSTADADRHLALLLVRRVDHGQGGGGQPVAGGPGGVPGPRGLGMP